MHYPITVAEIYNALKALLGLPEQCVSFELRAHAGGVVTIECEYWPSVDAQGIAQLAAVFGEYELVRREVPTDAPEHSLDWYVWARESAPLLQGMSYDAWVCHRAGVAHAVEAIGFDAWMLERTEGAHQAMMAHARGGVAYPDCLK